MKDCNPSRLPIQDVDYLLQTEESADKKDEYFMQDKPYRKAIGILMFLITGSRPDLAYSLSILSRFLSNPKPKHWRAIQQLLRYLKGTRNYSIRYEPISDQFLFSLSIYTDSSWGGDRTDGKSQHGYILLFNNSPISWRSTKQESVANSSVEAEFYGIAQAFQQLKYIDNVLQLSGIILPKLFIFSDSAGAIQYIDNGGSHSKLKWINIKYHYIREDLFKDPRFELRHVSGSENPADVFTKPMKLNSSLQGYFYNQDQSHRQELSQ
jgi:hypothetical protein